MAYPIKNVISSKKVPKWGNKKQYIAVHYLGVDGQNNDIDSSGCGAHYYIYWDGTIYQRCSHDAIVYQVGTAGGVYKQKHPYARNENTIGIEMCCHCDGNKSNATDPKWYFTKETQEACVQLVKQLMKELNLPASCVLRHHDIVNKHCPSPYVNNNHYKTSWTWDEFKAKLTADEPVGYYISDVKAADGKWYLYKDGRRSNDTTIAKNKNGWWYCKNGVVDFTFTGIAKNVNGTWYCEKGKVTFTFNGDITFGGKAYHVANSRAEEKVSAYKVRVTASVLNVRNEPNASSKINEKIVQNEVYTIVGESGGWGKLKSGAGWISLKYTERI